MPQITHLTTGKAELIAVEVPESSKYKISFTGYICYWDKNSHGWQVLQTKKTFLKHMIVGMSDEMTNDQCKHLGFRDTAFMNALLRVSNVVAPVLLLKKMEG